MGSNTLGLTRTGRDAVTWLQRKFRHMHLADSFSADLHKLGYCPYPSSIFVVRNAQDLNVLRHDSNLFTYFKVGGASAGAHTAPGWFVPCAADTAPFPLPGAV